MRSLVRGITTFLMRLRSGAIELSNRHYERRVDEIVRRGRDFSTLSDAALQAQLASVRERLRNRIPLEKVLVDAFAVIREVSRRTVGMQPFEVQLLAGIALHDRRLVEMQTGEGKTLAAVLPVA